MAQAEPHTNVPGEPVVVRGADVICEVCPDASATGQVVDRLRDVRGAADEVELGEQFLGLLPARLALKVLS